MVGISHDPTFQMRSALAVLATDSESDTATVTVTVRISKSGFDYLMII